MTYFCLPNIGFKRRTGWSSLRVRLLLLLAVVAAGLAMLFAPDAEAQPAGVNCETAVWGFMGTQRRTLCDGPVRADGSWQRLRIVWTPAYTTPLRCYGYFAYFDCHGGEFVSQQVNSREEYPVTPGTVLPDEPQHLAGAA